MAISDNYSPDVSTGNGVTTVFTGTWSPLAAVYMRVALESVSTGAQTLQTQGSDYTLTFSSAGYTVTMAIAPTSAFRVIRYREITIDQTEPFRTSQGWQGGAVEGSLDKLTAICQDLQDIATRSISFSVGSPISNVTLPNPVALNLIGWNDTADGLANYTALSSGTIINGFWEPVLLTGSAASAQIALGIDGNKGDVNVDAGADTWTINNGAVTLVKMANIDATSNGFVIGRLAGNGAPQLVNVNSLMPGYQYLSTEQTITTGGALTLAHGLGAIPYRVALFLVCKNTTRGWSANDVLPFSPHAQVGTAGDYGVGVGCDATNIKIRFGFTGVTIIDGTDGSSALINNSDWRLIVGASLS
jgi:hypothetical protein